MKKIYLAVLPLIVIVVGFYLLYRMLNQVEDQTLKQALELEHVYAKQCADGIEKFFEFHKNSLKYLSEIPAIINFTSISSDQSALSKIVMQEFYNNHRSRSLGITRIDKEGKVVYIYPERNDLIGTDVSYQDHNSLIINQQTPIVSDAFKTIQGDWAVAFAYPVFNKSGQYNGCITILFPFSKIAQEYISGIAFSGKGSAYMLSQSGKELYCSENTHIGKSIFETSAEYPSIIELSKKMLEGKKGYGTYFYNKTINNKVVRIEELVRYYPIRLENTFWSVAFTMPKEEILRNTSDLRRNLFTTIIATAIAICIILLIYYRNSKINQNNLIKNQLKYRTIAEQTGQLIFEWDLEADVFHFSGDVKQITGYDAETFNNKPVGNWVAKIHPIDADKVISAFDQAVREKKNFHFVYQFIRKDGEVIYIEDTSVYSEEFENKPKFLGTMKDITHRIEAEKELIEHRNELEQLVARRTRELKMANDELLLDIKKRKQTERELLEAKDKAEKSDNLKSEFLAQISHEIRTPVNVIQNYSSLIRYEFEDKLPKELEGSFDSINNAASRLLRTIDLIINMSEIETDNYEPSSEYLDLYEEIIYPLSLEYSQLANDKGLELSINNEADKSQLIIIDRYTVTKIFENLIENAIKYTEKGHIQIKLYNDTQYYMVEINDTGIGIAEEYFPNLFNKFSQEEQGYSRRFEGNGLGLALVNEYCKINNANIDVESEKGVGSSFKLTFTI